jgi:hypothetical protein
MDEDLIKVENERFGRVEWGPSRRSWEASARRICGCRGVGRKWCRQQRLVAGDRSGRNGWGGQHLAQVSLWERELGRRLTVEDEGRDNVDEIAIVKRMSAW